MPLGIESNSIAPQLIRDSGQALVQGIRQIGQQVSGHLTEIQTRRDLGALAQEFQGLNVQSNEFPTQFAQLITRHPLAARDERAQMALSALQKAHLNWQDEKTALARFPYRSMAGGGVFNAATGEVTTPPAVKPERPITLSPGAAAYDAQGNLIADNPKPEGPYTLGPGGVRFDAQGNKIAENPKVAPTLTPFQKHQIESGKRKERLGILKLERDQLNKQVAAFEKSLHETHDREKNLLGSARKAEREAVIRERSELGTQLQALGDILKAKMNEISKLEKEISAPAPLPEPGDSPTGDVIGTVPPPLSAAATKDLPVVKPADVSKLPSGTLFKGTNGRIYTAP